MKTETNNIPKLRFPDFNGELQKNTLGNIATFTKGKGISKDDISEDGVYECIRYGELYTYYKEMTKDIKSKTNIDKSELIFSEKNDVIIPASGETQLDIATACCVLKSGVALGSDLNIIKTQINGIFLAYYLSNAKKREIASLAQGVSVVHLYSTQLKTLKISFPTLPEQTKIANFLTAIDEKIQQLTKKKALLQQYKKGVMHKIFNQEIRFKDERGNNYADWEEKKLGEIGEIKGGKRIPKGYSLISENNGFPYITVSDMGKGTVSLEHIKYVPNEVVQTIKNYKVYIEDIFISVAGTLGIVGIVPKELNGANLTENANKITNLLCNQQFLLHVLNSEIFQKYVENVQTKNAQPKLAIYALNEFKMLLPNLPEQTKIATFLTSIDNKIDFVNKQLENTQQYKKGLLQQMFV